MSDTTPVAVEPSTTPVEVPPRIVFFCKDCERLVNAVKVGNKYVYRCPLCDTKNVAFGTEKSIRSFYRVREEEPVKPKPAAPAQIQAPSEAQAPAA